jgi:hypothetical protein
MKRIKQIFVLMITFALFACMSGVASAMTWHVDDEFGIYIYQYSCNNKIYLNIKNNLHL